MEDLQEYNKSGHTSKTKLDDVLLKEKQRIELIDFINNGEYTLTEAFRCLRMAFEMDTNTALSEIIQDLGVDVDDVFDDDDIFKYAEDNNYVYEVDYECEECENRFLKDIKNNISVLDDLINREQQEKSKRFHENAKRSDVLELLYNPKQTS
jgi:hypothetical protein